MNLETAKLVTFAILMEGGDGIMGKDPGYIMEKWDYISQCNREGQLKQILDEFNAHVYDNYITIWGSEAEEEPAVSPKETVEITEKGEKALEEAEKPRPKKGRHGG